MKLKEKLKTNSADSVLPLGEELEGALKTKNSETNNYKLTGIFNISDC
jgi:hypothetical protein